MTRLCIANFIDYDLAFAGLEDEVLKALLALVNNVLTLLVMLELHRVNNSLECLLAQILGQKRLLE